MWNTALDAVASAVRFGHHHCGCCDRLLANVDGASCGVINKNSTKLALFLFSCWLLSVHRVKRQIALVSPIPLDYLRFR